jgi:hypothetical protein
VKHAGVVDDLFSSRPVRSAFSTANINDLRGLVLVVVFGVGLLLDVMAAAV